MPGYFAAEAIGQVHIPTKQVRLRQRDLALAGSPTPEMVARSSKSYSQTLLLYVNSMFCVNPPFKGIILKNVEAGRLLSDSRAKYLEFERAAETRSLDCVLELAGRARR